MAAGRSFADSVKNVTMAGSVLLKIISVRMRVKLQETTIQKVYVTWENYTGFTDIN